MKFDPRKRQLIDLDFQQLRAWVRVRELGEAHRTRRRARGIGTARGIGLAIARLRHFRIASPMFRAVEARA